MRVLVVTKIFPNAKEPLSSPFNRQQFSALAKHAEVEVLATLPWFPGAKLFGKWSNAGRLSDVPAREQIGPLDVSHPRYVYLPRSGYALDGLLYAASVAPAVFKRRRADVILASWAYPDGVAGVLLGKALGIPVVVKVHGSDIDVISTLPGPRTNLKLILPRADRVVGVSKPLCAKVEALGVPADRIELVRNGVDDEIFHPRPRDEARAALGHGEDKRRWVVYVGRLDPAKGVLELAEALRSLAAAVPDVAVVFVGQGPARDALNDKTRGLENRVIFPGARPHHEVSQWMSAADVVCLPSHHEGSPNVVLEALACGRPVVATEVGGIPEIFAEGAAGRMVPVNDPKALAEALAKTLTEPSREGTFVPPSWDASGLALHAVLQRAISARG